MRSRTNDLRTTHSVIPRIAMRRRRQTRGDIRLHKVTYDGYARPLYFEVLFFEISIRLT